jgi:hypothetical protein
VTSNLWWDGAGDADASSPAGGAGGAGGGKTRVLEEMGRSSMYALIRQ